MNYVLGMSTLVAMVGAWFTHVIASLMAGKYLLLLVGVIFFPIGIIHGVGVWFGANW